MSYATNASDTNGSFFELGQLPKVARQRCQAFADVFLFNLDERQIILLRVSCNHLAELSNLLWLRVAWYVEHEIRRA